MNYDINELFAEESRKKQILNALDNENIDKLELLLKISKCSNKELLGFLKMVDYRRNKVGKTVGNYREDVENDFIIQAYTKGVNVQTVHGIIFKKLSASEIARHCNCSYSTVVSRLKKLGIYQYKNSELAYQREVDKRDKTINDFLNNMC